MNVVDSMEASGIAQFPKTRREGLLIQYFRNSISSAERGKEEAEDALAKLETETAVLETRVTELEKERDELEDKNNELMLSALES